MKILINTPSLNQLGGVANHYLGLRPYWHEDVKYNTVGKRSNKSGSGIKWLPWDIIKYINKLLFWWPDCVLVNPSIGYSALKRDFIFIKITHFFKIPVFTFIHGFDISTFERMNHKWLADNLNICNAVFVLANDFKNRLIDAGINIPIILSTTKVDDRLLDGFDIKTKDGKSGNILFLARVEKAKGIYETLETFSILQQRFPNITLNIVGNGGELESAKKWVASHNINNVTFSGRLDGRQVADAYKNALVLLLLSSHGEGMPTTVLEAMAFGLPVVTRPVGGLADFFKNEDMGFITDSLDPTVFADGIIPYLENPDKVINVGKYNHKYALEHFMASKVALSIEKYLKKYIRKDC